MGQEGLALFFDAASVNDGGKSSLGR